MVATAVLLLLMAQTGTQPVRAVTDPGVVTTRQSITPAGVSSIFQGRVYGAAWSDTSDVLWVAHADHLLALDWAKNRTLSAAKLAGLPGPNAIAFDRVRKQPLIAVSAREGDQGARARIFAGAATISPLGPSLGRFQPGGLSVGGAKNASGRRVIVQPLLWENKVAVLDAESGEVLQSIDTQTAPWAAVVSSDSATAFVANLGGRPPKEGEAFASPMLKPAERIPVDARGVASTGTVSRINIASGATVATIPVGLHPASLVWDEKQARLYVANANSDTITVIDTRTNAPLRTIALQPFSEKVRGISPTSLSITADGQRLFAACAGINAVIEINTATSAMEGLIPTGWFPNHVAVSPDGKHLAVTTLLGPGSGWREAPSKRYVHSYRGSVSVLPIPDRAQLASYSTAVAENNRLRLSGSAPAVPNRAAAKRPVAIPERSGEPSLIEHVVLIIKENRTYDQVLGDLPQGNGDPSLVMFGREVTPNQHRLAEQFVLLDNLYATGGNSADGHQWLTQGNETAYCLWPGYQGRSYPFDGTDPLAYSAGGFLWDYALARGRTVRVYGEYAGRMAEPVNRQRTDLLDRWKRGDDFTREWSIRAPIEPMNRFLAANYPAYSNSIPDVVRSQIFLADLKRFEAEGKLPNLILLQLPSDHTFGTTPGVSTPKAMVADNDLAVGQVVAALSKSKFWPKMAIFIVEDDAQNGVDHVDGHRTTAFVASPFARRKQVDSTFYSFQSILKTIELILGLPTMSVFDLIATDMRASFTDTPDLTPFDAEGASYDLWERNPQASALRGPARKAALASARMNWSIPDAVPTEKLNRILWGQIKGWNQPYPAPKRSVFSPLAVEVEDDDRDD